MDSVTNIYGYLYDNSEIVIGVGNYNNVHGLACYFPDDDLLQIKTTSDIFYPSVIELILHYEDNFRFFLEVKDKSLSQPKYVGINIDTNSNDTIASAVISSNKTLFTIDYSAVDKIPRSKLLSGTLYSLRTTLGEKDYIVSWKIDGFSNGDLVVFLPTTWYQNIDNVCEYRNGINNLVDSISQLQFKGYTTEFLCETSPHIINCHDDLLCGNCMGRCQNDDHICWPNNDLFVCGYPNKEPDFSTMTLVSFAETTPSPKAPPPTSGTTATWIAIIVILILVSLLAWALIRRNSS